jgi:zinc/manganese transport system substrate-binding protein
MATALVLAACATQPNTDQLTVVATDSILGDIVSNVVGDDAAVVVLIPVGADPHDFQPSARDAAELHDADLVVATGLGLEPGLADVLDSARSEGVPVLEVGEHVDPLPFGDSSAHEGEPGSRDPHFWTDPLRVGVAAEVIAEQLEEVIPGGAWRDNASAYSEQMTALDASIEAALSPVPAADRKLVTNHDAMGYFATRYGFEVIGTVIPGGSTLADPSSAELAELVATMEAEGVDVVFAEVSEPTALAEAIAAELGREASVVELFTESLGGPGSGAETLTEMLMTNATRIAGALAPAG